MENRSSIGGLRSDAQDPEPEPELLLPARQLAQARSTKRRPVGYFFRFNSWCVPTRAAMRRHDGEVGASHTRTYSCKGQLSNHRTLDAATGGDAIACPHPANPYLAFLRWRQDYSRSGTRPSAIDITQWVALTASISVGLLCSSCALLSPCSLSLSSILSLGDPVVVGNTYGCVIAAAIVCGVHVSLLAVVDRDDVDEGMGPRLLAGSCLNFHFRSRMMAKKRRYCTAAPSPGVRNAKHNLSVQAHAWSVSVRRRPRD
jgi:hypothetical protein